MEVQKLDNNNNSIAPDTTISPSSVIGTFEGKCADATVTNANGMDITRPVWEGVFNSEEFKNYIKLGHYIGFLGHPKDPGCGDFRNGCIIMRDGWIDDNGEVFGKFDLIDTPVGRIVKTFIDAGVQFGISVRGAGEVFDDGYVDPETFLFRGFDLVGFPAYDDAIPKFTEIAASTDVQSQMKYKKIVASVKANLPGIYSCEAIDVISEVFPDNSIIQDDLASRKSELETTDDDEILDVKSEQLDGLLSLYLETIKENRALKDELASKTAQLEDVSNNESIQSSRKLQAVKRITDDQIRILQSKNEELTSKYRTVIHANTRLKEHVQSINDRLSDEITACQGLRNQLSDYSNKYHEQVLSNRQLQNRLNRLGQKNLNLLQKVTASEVSESDKDSTIADLRGKLRETVTRDKHLSELSNRDKKIEELEADVKTALELVESYQDAYAQLYANILGKDLGDISICTTTTPSELKKLVAATNTSGIPAAPSIDEEAFQLPEDGVATV